MFPTLLPGDLRMLGRSAVSVLSTGLWSSLVSGGPVPCLSGNCWEGQTCLASPNLHWVLYIAGSPTVTADDSSLCRFHIQQMVRVYSFLNLKMCLYFSFLSLLRRAQLSLIKGKKALMMPGSSLNTMASCCHRYRLCSDPWCLPLCGGVGVMCGGRRLRLQPWLHFCTPVSVGLPA